MFKSFDGLNAALKNVDASKTYFLDCMTALVDTIRSGAALGQPTEEAYARAYAQVQQTKYDAEGNITDVTSKDRLTVPTGVLSRDAAKAKAWKGSLANAKATLKGVSIEFTVNMSVKQTVTWKGWTFTWLYSIEDGKSTITVDPTTSLALPDDIRREDAGWYFTSYLSANVVYTYDAYPWFRGPLGSIGIFPIRLDGNLIAISLRVISNSDRSLVKQYLWTQEGVKELDKESNTSNYIIKEPGAFARSLSSMPQGYSNPSLAMVTNIIGSEIAFPFDRVQGVRQIIIGLDSGLTVKEKDDGTIIVAHALAGAGDYEFPSYQPLTANIPAQSTNIAQVIVDNAPDYTPVADSLISLA